MEASVQGADNQQTPQIVRKDLADIASDLGKTAAAAFGRQEKDARPEAINVNQEVKRDDERQDDLDDRRDAPHQKTCDASD